MFEIKTRNIRKMVFFIVLIFLFIFIFNLNIYDFLRWIYTVVSSYLYYLYYLFLITFSYIKEILIIL